jgi:phosphatidate cytidylyltransferase
MNELAQRVVSALILGPLVLLLVWWGNPGFALLMMVAAAAIIWEWNAIMRRLNDQAMVVAALCAVLAVLAAALGQWLAASLVLILGAAISQLLASRAGDAGRLLWLGMVYAALPAAALVFLRDDPQWGRSAIFWLLFIVWATDIGAYVAGRQVGGPKLWPALSPNKTWAGAAGGLTAALAVGLAFTYGLAARPDNLFGLVVLIVALSVAAQLGDLAESALKRRFNVKDSSQLIPGHGGVMDRVDGLVATAIVAGVIGAIRAGPDAAGAGLLLW